MPEAIVRRILRAAGYAVHAHELEETASRLTLWDRQTAAELYYACGALGSRSGTSTVGPSGGFVTCRGAPGRSGWCLRCIACVARGVLSIEFRTTSRRL